MLQKMIFQINAVRVIFLFMKKKEEIYYSYIIVSKNKLGHLIKQLLTYKNNKNIKIKKNCGKLYLLINYNMYK